jgi:hypothetical protein
MSTLSGLQGVNSQGELFLSRSRVSDERWDSGFALPRYIETKPNGLKIRPFSVFSYLNMLYSKPGIVGFKLMYAQLGSYPEILAYLIRYRIRVVHLVRQNHLDVLISYAVKAQLGKAHLLSGQSAPDEVRVDLDPNSLVRQIARLRKKQNLARKLLTWCKLPQMEIAYEDLLRDQANFGQILNFLSIDPQEQKTQSTVVKIRRGGHRDVIKNYEEVKHVLAGSKFAAMLD